MREVVESWWNGHHGSLARVRLRLCRDTTRWSVEQEGPGITCQVTPCFSEAQARAELLRLKSVAPPGAWRRVDSLGRRSAPGAQSP